MCIYIMALKKMHASNGCTHAYIYIYIYTYVYTLNAEEVRKAHGDCGVGPYTIQPKA